MKIGRWIIAALLAAMSHAAAAQGITGARSLGPDPDYPKPPLYGTSAYYEPLGAFDREELCARGIGPSTGGLDYRYQDVLFEQAGTSAAEPEEEQGRKIRAWWSEAGPWLTCVADMPVLQYHSRTQRGDAFLADAFDTWRLPLNDVNPNDGRTLLDYLADEYVEKRRLPRLARLYHRAREAGALHRIELEETGAIPAKRALQAEMIERHRAVAAEGNVASMVYIARDLWANGDRVGAEEWYERVARRAVETGDVFVMVEVLGHGYRDGRYMPRDYPKALQWYRRAADLNDFHGAYWLGTAYEVGDIATRNSAQAIEWLSRVTTSKYRDLPRRERWISDTKRESGDVSGRIARLLIAEGRRDEAIEFYKNQWTNNQSMRIVGDWYLARGDRANAELYYRTGMRWTPGYMDGNDGYPSAIRWMRQNGFNPCGPILGADQPWIVENMWGGCPANTRR